MVIPPSCPGLNVEILVDGQPLQEYDDVDENPVPPNTVTKYIEARSNVNFSIRAKFDAKFPFPAGHVQFKTSLDQQHTQGILIPAQYLFHPEGTMNEGYFSYTGGETHDLYKYRFIAIDLVESDDAQVANGLAKDIQAMGIITVELQFFRTARMIQPRPNVFVGKTFGEISEKTFKGQPKSHHGGLDPGVPRMTGGCFALDLIGNGPFVTVNFKYRSLEVLRALRIIPRAQTPLPLEARPEEDLTPDELRQVVRLLKDRDAAALKIKKEASSKRSRSDAAETVGEDDVVIVEGPSRKRRRSGNSEVIVLD